MQREDVQLEGIPFPQNEREDGASLEILSLDSSKDIERWIVDNHYAQGENKWGFISQSTTKKETVLLSLSFRRIVRRTYKVSAGRLQREQTETTEPEIGELHFRRDGILELYSLGASLRNGILKSLEEEEIELKHLILSKNSMLSLAKEAAEISSVSLSGLGNPFFSEATLKGSDPLNSRTFKELQASGTIKSLRGKFYLDSDLRDEESSRGGATGSLSLSLQSNCKVRFFAVGDTPLAQSEIEGFVSRLSELATRE